MSSSRYETVTRSYAAKARFIAVLSALDSLSSSYRAVSVYKANSIQQKLVLVAEGVGTTAPTPSA